MRQEILNSVSDPSQNVFIIPKIFSQMIISNDMIYILVRLLSEDPNKRFNDVHEVRKVLNQLKENIENTPSNLKLVLGHPLIDGEILS